MPDEARNILGLYHALFDKLRTADDALQGRFQLVRDVRRELAPVTLGVLLLGYIKGKDNCACGIAAGLDAAYIKLILAPAARHPYLAVSGFSRFFHGGRHIVAALNGEEIRPDAVAVHGEKLPRGSIYAQHCAVVIQQHKPFFHAARHLREFVRAPTQLAYLRFYFSVLGIYTFEKRSKLLIHIVFKRVVKVECVERLHYTARQAPCEHAREYQRRGEHNKHRLYHTHREHSRRLAADGYSQHAAVREAAC